MSGGSYDYIYSRVETAASDITPTTPLRKLFKSHLFKVAKALHDIEWVDSGDCCPGDENESIKACFGESVPLELMKQSIGEAETVAKQLGTAIENARKEVKDMSCGKPHPKGGKKGGCKGGCKGK